MAQFDEADEGTAIFKATATASQLPAEGNWLALDADGQSLPSDWYLRLAGEAQKMLEGMRSLTSTIPISPQDPPPCCWVVANDATDFHDGTSQHDADDGTSHHDVDEVPHHDVDEVPHHDVDEVPPNMMSTHDVEDGNTQLIIIGLALIAMLNLVACALVVQIHRKAAKVVSVDMGVVTYDPEDQEEFQSLPSPDQFKKTYLVSDETDICTSFDSYNSFNNMKGDSKDEAMCSGHNVNDGTEVMQSHQKLSICHSPREGHVSETSEVSNFTVVGEEIDI